MEVFAVRIRMESVTFFWVTILVAFFWLLGLLRPRHLQRVDHWNMVLAVGLFYAFCVKPVASIAMYLFYAFCVKPVASFIVMLLGRFIYMCLPESGSFSAITAVPVVMLLMGGIYTAIPT